MSCTSSPSRCPTPCGKEERVRAALDELVDVAAQDAERRRGRATISARPPRGARRGSARRAAPRERRQLRRQHDLVERALRRREPAAEPATCASRRRPNPRGVSAPTSASTRSPSPSDVVVRSVVQHLAVHRDDRLVREPHAGSEERRDHRGRHFGFADAVARRAHAGAVGEGRRGGRLAELRDAGRVVRDAQRNERIRQFRVVRSVDYLGAVARLDASAEQQRQPGRRRIVVRRHGGDLLARYAQPVAKLRQRTHAEAELPGRGPRCRRTGRPRAPTTDPAAERRASAPARPGGAQPRESNGRPGTENGCRREKGACWPDSSSLAAAPPAKAR